MKTIIRLLIMSTASVALICNAAFAESDYIQHIRAKAKARQAWAEKSMGDAFYFGIDMKADQKKAFDWYKKSAKQDYPSAMHAVGRSYYFGEGVKQDYKKAAAEYRKAAEKNDGKSLYSLAQMYQYGIGVKPNILEAEDLYRKAIKKDLHKTLLYSLARMYLENPDLVINGEGIFRWLILLYYEGANSEYVTYAIDDLWRTLSPVQQKQILAEYHNEFPPIDGNPAMQDAISGIGAKIAVANTPSESLSPKDIYNRVWRSVVYIEIDNSYIGSGVIVQPDIVATNCHVVDGANVIRVYQPKERSGREDTVYFASSPVPAGEKDYCLLHVPLLPGSGIPATIRPYDTLEIGEVVYALGAPDGKRLSLSRGIISQLRDEVSYIYQDLIYAPARAIQSDVDIAPGSSGGGLFDSAGNLIGHPTFGSPDQVIGSDLEGLEFSIPADIIILEF